MADGDVVGLPDNFHPDMGDPEMAELVLEYLTHSQENLIEMRRALDQNDLPTVKHMAHYYRGSGGMFGFGGVSILGGKIEDGINNGDSAERLSWFMTQLEAMLQRARTQFMPR